MLILVPLFDTLQVDRLYGWKTCRNSPIVKAMKQQTKDVQNEFNMRLTQVAQDFIYLLVVPDYCYCL